MHNLSTYYCSTSQSDDVAEGPIASTQQTELLEDMNNATLINERPQLMYQPDSPEPGSPTSGSMSNPPAMQVCTASFAEITSETYANHDPHP